MKSIPLNILLWLGVCLCLWGHQDHATISAYAINCKNGEVVFNENGEKSLLPASCLKVVTTGAALHLLGPNYRFQTDLEMEGEIQEGVLKGNVILRGGGDPCLGSGRLADSLEADQQIEVWVGSIEEKGIKEIEGEVRGDASRWEKALAPSGWLWEDLGNYYGAGACALTFHENMSTVTFKPGPQEGAPATLLYVVPALANFVMHNEVTTGPVGSGDQACIFGFEYSPVQYVRGTVPAGVNTFSIKGLIPDPAQLCSELLIQALEKKGIKVLGNAPLKNLGMRVIHTTFSPEVREIVYWTNQKSINLYAEHLLKAMGQGKTLEGTQAVLRFWKEQGIDIKGMNIVDGSGLSRKNFMTTQQLAEILVKMKKSPYFIDFYASLPEHKNGERAKTGFMSFHRCLAGYKGDVAFAIFINYEQDAQNAKEKIDQIVSKL